MKFDSALVSTDEKNPILKLDARKAANCDQVFSDEGVRGAGNPDKRKRAVLALTDNQTGAFQSSAVKP